MSQKLKNKTRNCAVAVCHSPAGILIVEHRLLKLFSSLIKKTLQNSKF